MILVNGIVWRVKNNVKMVKPLPVRNEISNFVVHAVWLLVLLCGGHSRRAIYFHCYLWWGSNLIVIQLTICLKTMQIARCGCVVWLLICCAYATTEWFNSMLLKTLEAVSKNPVFVFQNFTFQLIYLCCLRPHYWIKITHKINSGL